MKRRSPSPAQDDARAHSKAKHSGAGSFDEGRAIPLIAVEGDRFVFTDEARAFLESLREDVAVVAVAGKYRTGKSYLLNRVLLQLERDAKGFGVGGTIQACTKGLWIYTRPVRDDSGRAVLIVDSEGIGAFNATDTHDSRIFALALLLSSYFIYNSVGTIDESAISTLSLVANLSKCVRVESTSADNADITGNALDAQAEGAELSEAAELGEHFPDFLWLVRDFGLDLVTADGERMTSREYLESALASPAAADDANAEKSRIRKLLRAYFPRRDCETLVRPCNDEAQLRELDTASPGELRAEFVAQANALRRKVLGSAPIKQTLGSPLNGPLLAELCAQYCDAMNAGACPAIRDSWCLLAEARAQQAIEEATREFASSASQLELPLNSDALSQALDACARVAEAKFHALCFEPTDAEGLRARIAEHRDRIEQENAAALERSLWAASRALDEVAFVELEQHLKRQLKDIDEAHGAAGVAVFAPLAVEHSWQRFGREHERLHAELNSAQLAQERAEARAEEASRHMIKVERNLDETERRLEEAEREARESGQRLSAAHKAELESAQERLDAALSDARDAHESARSTSEQLARVETELAQLQASEEISSQNASGKLQEALEERDELAAKLAHAEEKLALAEESAQAYAESSVHQQQLEAELQAVRAELADKEDEAQQRIAALTRESRQYLDEIRRSVETERAESRKRCADAEASVTQLEAALERSKQESKHREERLSAQLEDTGSRAKKEIANLERALEFARSSASELRDEAKAVRVESESALTALRAEHARELREREESARAAAKEAQSSLDGLHKELQALQSRASVAELRADTQTSRCEEIEAQLKEERKRKLDDRSSLDLARMQGKVEVLESSNFELKRKLGEQESARAELERKLRQRERDFDMDKLKLEMDYELRAVRGTK